MNKRIMILATVLIILFLITACDLLPADGIGNIFKDIHIISDLGDAISELFESIVDSIDIRVPSITIF